MNKREIYTAIALYAIVSHESGDPDDIADEAVSLADAVIRRINQGADDNPPFEVAPTFTKCCVPTARGKPCRVGADRERNGKWYCHLHDPQGVNQRRMRGDR